MSVERNVFEQIHFDDIINHVQQSKKKELLV